MPRTKEPPTLYSVHKTFIWFAVISLVLTFSLAAIVYVDYVREWKTYQKKFIRLKTDRAKKELKEAEAKIDKKKLESLEKQLKDADAALTSHSSGRMSLEIRLGRLDTEVTKARSQTQNLKQFEDSAKYFFEETRSHNDPKASEYEKKLKELTPKLSQAKLNLEKLEKEIEEKQSALNGMTAAEKSIQKSIDRGLEDKNRMER